MTDPRLLSEERLDEIHDQDDLRGMNAEEVVALVRRLRDERDALRAALAEAKDELARALVEQRPAMSGYAYGRLRLGLGRASAEDADPDGMRRI